MPKPFRARMLTKTTQLVTKTLTYQEPSTGRWKAGKVYPKCPPGNTNLWRKGLEMVGGSFLDPSGTCRRSASKQLLRNPLISVKLPACLCVLTASHCLRPPTHKYYYDYFSWYYLIGRAWLATFCPSKHYSYPRCDHH